MAGISPSDVDTAMIYDAFTINVVIDLEGARFCGRYNACGRPVLFVRDDWYTRSYVPAYREHYRPERVIEYREPRHMVREVERVEYREHDRGRHEGWDRGGERHGEGRGHGEGHGEGHGHGHGRD